MIDISDGLVADLSHIAKASGVLLDIETARLPADPALRAWCRSICCEMHAGFQALRKACAMNLWLPVKPRPPKNLPPRPPLKRPPLLKLRLKKLPRRPPPRPRPTNPPKADPDFALER